MSWDYPNPALDAEGEGELTLGFSFGWAPGLPKKPIPAFFSALFLQNAWIPLASAGRKSAGREEKLGLGSEAETKPCWCQAWSCLLPSRWGFIFTAFPAKNHPGAAPLGSSSFLGGWDPVQALPVGSGGLLEQRGTMRFRSSRAERQSSR